MDKINQLIASGVQPLSLAFQSVISTEFKSAFAYRSQLRINDIDMGVLLPNQYEGVSFRTTQSAELAYWCFDTLIDAVMQFDEKKIEVEWVSLAAPVRLLQKPDGAKKLARLIKEKSFLHPEKLLLEFSCALLYEDMTIVAANIELLHALGLKVAIEGFGSEFCPLLRLAPCKADVVFMEAELTPKLFGTEDAITASTAVQLALDCGATVIINETDESMLEDAYRHNISGAVGKVSGRYKKLAALLKSN